VPSKASVGGVPPNTPKVKNELVWSLSGFDFEGKRTISKVVRFKGGALRERVDFFLWF